MANQQQVKQPHRAAAKKKQQSGQGNKVQPKAKSNGLFVPVALCVILLISLAAYWPALKNGFVNWDDDRYIQSNPLIYTINLKDIFFQYAFSNYHPLTMLTYALEYKLFGISGKG